MLVNNSSAAPFRLVPPPGGARLAVAPPAATWRAAAAGELDAAIVPVAMLARTRPAMDLAGDFGVACDGPVGSVLLLSRLPPEQLAAGRGRVRLSTESETSRRLLRILFRQEFGREFETTDDVAQASAELVIGDVALRARQDRERWPLQVDLCDWWKRRTGLPFVFARWVVRHELPAQDRRALADWLEACAACAATPGAADRLARTALADGLFADPASARGYFTNLRCRFGERELAGERAFVDALAQAWPPA